MDDAASADQGNKGHSVTLLKLVFLLGGAVGRLTTLCQNTALPGVVLSNPLKSNELGVLQNGGNIGSERSCPWAWTLLVSKDTFNVVDNLPGTMARCRANQNLCDTFTGKVICMHASLVFLFLALGFVQLLIFWGGWFLHH